jgi:hypothetical protein
MDHLLVLSIKRWPCEMTECRRQIKKIKIAGRGDIESFLQI